MRVEFTVLKGAQVLWNFGGDFKYYSCCNVLDMIALYKWEKIMYCEEWKVLLLSPVRKKKQQNKSKHFRIISLVYNWSWWKNLSSGWEVFCSLIINLTVEKSPARKGVDSRNIGKNPYVLP